MASAFSPVAPGIVGTGRVARAFALALGRSFGVPVRIWGRREDHAGAAAAATGARVMARLDELAGTSDLLVIAVSDDALGDVVARIAASDRLAPSALAVHVSGRSGAAVLRPLAARGALTAALHPAMTFTGDTEAEVGRMAGARFAMTASSPAAADRATALAQALRGVPVAIEEHHRALYHAALSHAANHLVTLVSGAADALQAAGVDDPGTFLGPLVRAALANTLDHGFSALSGPVLRGDVQTVAGHLSAIDHDCPAIAPAYRAMALATRDKVVSIGASHGYEPLRALLEDEAPTGNNSD